MDMSYFRLFHSPYSASTVVLVGIGVRDNVEVLLYSLYNEEGLQILVRVVPE